MKIFVCSHNGILEWIEGKGLPCVSFLPQEPGFYIRLTDNPPGRRKRDRKAPFVNFQTITLWPRIEFNTWEEFIGTDPDGAVSLLKNAPNDPEFRKREDGKFVSRSTPQGFSFPECLTKIPLQQFRKKIIRNKFKRQLYWYGLFAGRSKEGIKLLLAGAEPKESLFVPLKNTIQTFQDARRPIQTNGGLPVGNQKLLEDF